MLLFGASGTIGQAVAQCARASGWTVVGATRSVAPITMVAVEWLRYDPLCDDAVAVLSGQKPFDCVCWAQGANSNDAPRTFNATRHLALYEANCLSVLISLSALLANERLSEGGARLVVVSSIWQERARQNKLSYTMTKAAIGGLVRSASVDLGKEGHLINAVLPGVLETPMTAANLTPAQVGAVCAKTTFGRLPDLATLAQTILFLCSKANGSISGQSITVDLGMNIASLV